MTALIPERRGETPWQVTLSRLAADRRDVFVERDRGYGPDPRHRFDRYRPKRGADPTLPTLIFVYGGRWTTGERGCYAFLGSALAKHGFEVRIPDYRLFPDVRFPTFVEDIALCYGHAALSRSRRQPSPFLMGHSAGAHIAALLAFDPGYRQAVDSKLPKPSGLIGISGPYTFDPTTWETTKNIFAPTAGEPDRARPISFVRRSAPPSLLIHGGRDRVVNAIATHQLHGALESAGVRSTKRIYGYLGHGGPILAIARPMRWFLPVFSDVVTFAREAAQA